MIHINNIKRTLFLCFIALMTSSCESWLDVSPETEVKYDDLFSDRNGFKDQLTGIYTAMCSEDLYGANLTFGMLDAMGQQYTWTQEQGNYYHLWRFEYDNSTSQSVINGVWNDMYNAIANVNILLKGIEEHRGVMRSNEESIYEGEAYALRAFLHYDLLRLFGKSYAAGANTESIPYVTSISKTVTPLSTVAEVIDLALNDLEKAVELLVNDPIKTGEETTDFLGTRSYHLNYYAVKALMARLYLSKNDKTNALACAKEVIDSDKFPWVNSEKVTSTTRESRDGIFKTECIFMLNNRKLESLVESYLQENTGGYLLMMDPTVRDEIFETTLYGYDWRYNYFFETLKEYYCGSTKLWQVSGSDYNNRQPLLRVSEMWLIAAESTSNMEDAVGYINTLRQHRGFDETDDLKADGMTSDALQTIIGKEYRKEFIGEGQWFFYCKRKDVAELPNTKVPFSKSYYVLPMPDQEIDYGNRN